MSPPELRREKNPTFELKIISANDVSHINTAYKMDVYAVVSITGDNVQMKQAAKTPIDFYGGSNPTWNHTVKFSVNEEATRLTLKVKLFSYWLEDEDDLYLGEVNVSVQDLLASNPLPPFPYEYNSKLKMVTYPVKTTERTKGTISLSYRFKPAAQPVDDHLSPSAPDYSLSFGQPVNPNPDLASSGQPLYPNLDPASLGHPVMYSPQLQTTMTKLTLELVIKSAKDIKSVSIRDEMNAYASVMIREGNTKIKDSAKTPIAYCAYRNPRWNHEMKFPLDEKLVREGRLTLVVKLIGVRPLFGDKNVGEVVVSIQELFGLKPPSPPLTNGGEDSGMSLVTRDVTEGKGTLTFTYRFLEEQAPQPFIVYPIHGTSGYAIVHPGANAGPSIGQLPICMPPDQYHQSHGYQQYSPPRPQPQPQPHRPQPQIQPHRPQSQIQPLHQPLLHTQSQSPSQPQPQPQLLPQQIPPMQHPTQLEPQAQGAKPAVNSQGGNIAALGLGAASIMGRVIGGALMGDMMMSDELSMYEC